MRKMGLVIFMTFAFLAAAQKAAKTTPKPLSKPAISIPRMELGTVSGRSYTNASIGVQFTVVDGLEFQSPELKGTPGSVPELVTVMAWQKEGMFSPRKVTYFYSDALAAYPEDQRSTDVYMRKVIKFNVTTNYKAVEETPQFTFNSVHFARADFTGPLYEVVLVKSCETQALVFIFGISNSDKKAVDKLITQTTLKLDPVRSGCHDGNPVAK